jgi:hypothetical protein
MHALAIESLFDSLFDRIFKGTYFDLDSCSTCSHARLDKGYGEREARFYQASDVVVRALFLCPARGRRSHRSHVSHC